MKGRDPDPDATARRSLWELPAHCHDALVGSGWRRAELRRLTDRLFAGASRLDDFELHAAVVAQCSTRNRLSLALQRDLQRRAKPWIGRTASVSATAPAGALWQQALDEGEVAAALWALWTDPCCDDALQAHWHKQLFVLQHERVAALRDDTARWAACRAELQAERDAAARALARHARWRAEALAERKQLHAQLAASRQALVTRQAQQPVCVGLLPAGAEAGDLTAPRHALVMQVAALRQQLREARRCSAPPLAPLAPGGGPAGSAAVSGVTSADTCKATVLHGKVRPALHSETAGLQQARVLCVGGRSGQVPQYRQLVERHGGYFEHHDGGIEHNPHRLDAQLASADLVVCQSGCLNHNAYARVKAHCRRSGTPCVYLDKPGAGAFARSLTRALGCAAAQAGNASAWGFAPHGPSPAAGPN